MVARLALARRADEAPRRLQRMGGELACRYRTMNGDPTFSFETTEGTDAGSLVPG